MSKVIYVLEDNRPDKTKNRGIIFVHEATGCNQVWKSQIKYLSVNIKVIIMNLSGHFNSKCPEPPTMEIYVLELDELIETLKLDKIILAGHSLGGVIILLYYLKYPQKISGLILIGTGAYLRVMPIILD